MSGFYYRHFLKLLDSTSAELSSLLQLAAKPKADKKSGKEEARPTGKNIVLTFGEDSICTRCSFEVAAYDQGARVIYLDSSGSQIGHKKLIKSTTRVLGRMYDGVQYRGYGQEIVETLAEYADVSAWSGLTNKFHPMQLLADLLIMQKHLPGKVFNEMMLAYVGDARNNVGNSILEAVVLTGLDLRLAAPQAYQSGAALVAECSALAQKHGDKIVLTEDTASGVKGADFVHTGVRVSMGEPKEKWAERIALLRDYQANSKTVAPTDNSQTRFLHCLPASHGEQTMLGKRMVAEFGLYGGMEITGEVFEFPVSTVFDQAENRMYTIKAVMVVILTK